MKGTQKQTSGIGHCVQWMIGLLVVGTGTYLLLPEFRSQIINALPFLILLLCPLMHIFMHKGHGKHHGDHDRS